MGTNGLEAVCHIVSRAARDCSPVKSVYIKEGKKLRVWSYYYRWKLESEVILLEPHSSHEEKCGVDG